MRPKSNEAHFSEHQSINLPPLNVMGGRGEASPIQISPGRANDLGEEASGQSHKREALAGEKDGANLP